jgi:SAM-dependent methyltransferase
VRNLKINDAFGIALWDHHHSGRINEIIETSDGYIWTTRGGMRMYFAPYTKWSRAEKTAVSYTKGTVLDIGCGAGRHSLWLEERGQQVTAIDASFLATEVAKLRGVKDVRCLPVERITDIEDVRYETVLMLGNGFGLFGTVSKARRLLKQLAKLTTPDGIIIADSTDPKYLDKEVFRDSTVPENPKRLSGQMRIRYRYRDGATPWFDFSYVSLGEIERIIKGTGWVLQKHIKGTYGHYAVVLSKK